MSKALTPMSSSMCLRMPSVQGSAPRMAVLSLVSLRKSTPIFLAMVDMWMR